MVKVLVVYDSKYGNTKRVAQKIASSIKRDDAQVTTGYVKETVPEEVANFNVLVIGAPNHMGKPSRTARKFVEKLEPLKLDLAGVAVFDTYFGKPRNFEKSTRKMEKLLAQKLPNVKLLVPSLSVQVLGIKGPIAEGELPKSEEFGKKIADTLTSAKAL